MRLWTIQPISVLNIINETGEYFVNEDYISEYFKPAYQWMRTKMKEKIGEPKNKKIFFPVWAWHTTLFNHKKPDLRKNVYGKKDEWYVCIEIEIPDEEVVLSDFESWHFVLNNSYLIAECYDEESYDKEYRRIESLNKEERNNAIRKSWDEIFNIKPFCNDFMCRGRYIQATFWGIKKEQVKKIWFYKER